LPRVYDLGLAVGLLEVLGVFGDDVVGTSSFRTLVDAVIVVMTRYFQPVPRLDSYAGSLQQVPKLGNPARVKVLKVATGEYTVVFVEQHI
jgi:hypothetical protein